MARTMKRTYTITKNELDLIEEIKDRGLSKKVVLNDSQIVRFGIQLVSKLSIEKLVELVKESR